LRRRKDDGIVVVREREPSERESRQRERAVRERESSERERSRPYGAGVSRKQEEAEERQDDYG